MASLLDLAQARLGGLLAPQRPSMAGLLGGQRTQGNLASALQGYTPPQMTALTNPQVMDYARNVAQSAQQNLQTQMSDLDKAIVMGQQGVQVGDREALARLMEQVPGLMGATAYHGTPHTIRGKFDISKVGTGEGAQAYGHGMYFAEAPDVAKSYMTVGGKGEFVRIGDKVVPTASQEGQLLSDVTKLGRKAAINKYPDQADYIKTINPDNIQFEGGNLYKVDIPDEYIPKMLNWDKPLSQQPKSVQDALAKLDPDLYSKKGLDYDSSELGQSIYYRLRNLAKDKINQEINVEKQTLLNKYNAKSFQESKMSLEDNARFHALLNQEKLAIAPSEKQVSEMLNSVGVKGIRYLDEGSRKTGGTSNFVVFDPTDVKILEKNSQKVEGLLD